MAQAKTNGLMLEDVGDITMVTIGDWQLLQQSNALILEEWLLCLPKKLQRTRIMINFEKVTLASHAGLTPFLALDRAVGAKKGKLLLYNIKPQVWAMFEALRLDQELHCVKDKNMALEELNK